MRESRKEDEFHDARVAGIGGFEMVQGHVERKNIQIRRPEDCPGLFHHPIQGQSLRISPALSGAPLARVIHQDPSHGSSRHTQKVAPVFPTRALELKEPQAGLMDECGRLQGVVASLAGHVASGRLPQLAIDDRKQHVVGSSIPLTQPRQKSGHIRFHIPISP